MIFLKTAFFFKERGANLSMGLIFFSFVCVFFLVINTPRTEHLPGSPVALPCAPIPPLWQERTTLRTLGMVQQTVRHPGEQTSLFPFCDVKPSCITPIHPQAASVCSALLLQVERWAPQLLGCHPLQWLS